ncbi:mannose-P-dolichol utilization defect 1 protein-like isoform X2 [Gadus chalcogrammus]|uniref:mannose-P-dolichol utilization defect 1 protein-like isoform X2 n=1 Tax=Gadus chalcogrammus TaxID=1042646 RepID=UPI0024C32938|nr:mannose-P-dolichol utilization defect 1 protein-like isoform X2 [Gadus chalcogrammus]
MTTSEGLDPTSPVKEFILLYLMPEKCFEYFFTNLNFLHVPCLKIVLSKTVGLWIVLGTVLAQLPQLLRLTRRGSAEGVSLGSALLHLYSISGPLVYCLARDFPLSAWSDKLFIAVQAASVCFLLLHYRGRTIQGCPGWHQLLQRSDRRAVPCVRIAGMGGLPGSYLRLCAGEGHHSGSSGPHTLCVSQHCATGPGPSMRSENQHQEQSQE